MKKMVKKICLKCKREFETEADPYGIPYKRICKSCKKNQRLYGRGISSGS